MKKIIEHITNGLVFIMAIFGLIVLGNVYFSSTNYDSKVLFSVVLVGLLITAAIVIWDSFMRVVYKGFQLGTYRPKRHFAVRQLVGIFLLFSTVFTFYTGFYTYYGTVIAQDKAFTPLSLSSSYEYVTRELENPVHITQINESKVVADSFSFLFLIDHTGSTEIEKRVRDRRGTASDRAYVNQLIPLKKAISKKFIESDQKEEEYIKNHSIKTLMAMYMLNQIKSQFSQGNSHFALASLESELRLIKGKEKVRWSDCWRPINEQEIKNAINNIEEYEKKVIYDETTNFQVLFKGVRERLLVNGDLDKQGHFDKHDQNLVIIIISDFHHEDKIVPFRNIELEIKQIAEFEHTSELNLINIPAYNIDYNKSSDLVELINKYFRFIPFTEEKMLNMINFCEEDLFANQLQSLVSPTLQKEDHQIKFKFSSYTENMDATVKTKCDRNIPIVLKLKSNHPESLKDTRIEYSSDKGSTYKRLYYPIPEKIM
ncbi:MAG: hypothetical protein AAF985_20360, partial [Bacteroidota bacterium]